MALSFSESIPIVFYSLFALIIVVILILIKTGKIKPDESEEFAENKMYQMDILYCVEDKKIPGWMYLCPEDAVPRSPVVEKRRNRPRYHRKTRPREERDRARLGGPLLSPMFTEYHSPLPSSGNTSCTSQFSNNTSQAGRENMNYETDVSDESLQFSERRSREDTSVRKARQFSYNCREHDPRTLNNSCEVFFGSGATPSRLSPGFPPAHSTHFPSNDVEKTDRTCRIILDHNPSALREQAVQGLCDQPRDQREVKPSSPNLTMSSNEEGQIHLASHALPTNTKLNELCADSRLDTVCLLPQVVLPACHPGEDSNVARNIGKQVSDHYQNGAEDKPEKLSMINALIPRDNSPLAVTSSSNDSCQMLTCSEGKIELESSSSAKKDDTKRGSRKKKTHRKTKLERATKEVITAHIPHTLSSDGSWTTVTETTIVQETSSWDSL
ncbi:hypothetical protein RRG08_015613 [Elysia crispata]|uniref:Uncharacterized protein n=1 Tax=Elysia crispata TaxID=231223 RepID=A0AAE0YI99_9GAST|nr:hypothetical protein RRG08_015613 [Elysia crispata]